MKLIFVRHGKTSERGGDSFLIKRGRKQVVFLAKRLKKFKIDKIYSSDLARAKQTAKIISKELELPITITSDLREYSIDLLKKNKKNWTKEEIKQFKRLRSFLRKISKKPEKTENILLISHGITNRLIISYFLNILYKKMLSFRQKNTCMNIIYWANYSKNWRLETMNDYSHLPPELK